MVDFGRMWLRAGLDARDLMELFNSLTGSITYNPSVKTINGLVDLVIERSNS